MTSISGGDSHHLSNDFVSSRRKRVAIVVANPATNQHGWPVGFWAAELTHPYYELTERGVDVTLASPDGGKVVVDGLSDPGTRAGGRLRTSSRWVFSTPPSSSPC